MKKTDFLYKLDSNKNIRVWCVEYDEEKYRTISGVKNGSLVESGWVYPEKMNVGKKNETTISEQVLNEINSRVSYQLNQGKYHQKESDVGKGASFIECMLAVTYDPKKHKDFPYIAQPKLDGGRALSTIEGNVQTRYGKIYMTIPHIEETVRKFNKDFPDYILDGELYNHELKNDFEKIMSLVKKTKNITEDVLSETEKKIQFYVYDIIPPYPMSTEDRIKFLEENVYGKYDHIQRVESVIVKNEEELKLKFEKDLLDGFEGTMIRDTKAVYHHKRHKSLIKCKVFTDIEVEVVDLVEGDGVWMGRAKSATIRLPDGQLQDSNIIGDFKKTKELLENKHLYIGGMATVKFQNYTSENKLRFPFVKFFWGNKRTV